MGASNSYDPNEDVFKLLYFKKSLLTNLEAFKTDIEKPKKQNAAELKRVVNAAVEHFKKLVEKIIFGRLFGMVIALKENVAAQLLFFGVADTFL